MSFFCQRRTYINKYNKKNRKTKTQNIFLFTKIYLYLLYNQTIKKWEQQKKIYQSQDKINQQM